MQRALLHRCVVDIVFRPAVLQGHAGVFVLRQILRPVEDIPRAGEEVRTALLVHLHQHIGIVHKFHDAAQLLRALGNFQIADDLLMIGHLLHNAIHHSLLPAGEKIPVGSQHAVGIGSVRLIQPGEGGDCLHSLGGAVDQGSVLVRRHGEKHALPRIEGDTLIGVHQRRLGQLLKGGLFRGLGHLLVVAVIADHLVQRGHEGGVAGQLIQSQLHHGEILLHIPVDAHSHVVKARLGEGVGTLNGGVGCIAGQKQQSHQHHGGKYQDHLCAQPHGKHLPSVRKL